MGLFDKYKAELFTTYRCKITIRDRIMGGIPNDPKIMQSWLKVKMGVTQEDELQRLVVETLAERNGEPITGAKDDAAAGFEAVDALSESVSMEKKANGFKRDANGLYLESRCVKALLNGPAWA